MKGLIVEDDLFFKRVVELRIRAWRSDVDLVHAENLKRARELLDDSQNQFSFVILDQRLPDGVGSELLDHPALQSCAVLAVSADESPDIPGQAVRAGAQHFLDKRQVTEPLFLPLLSAIVERKEFEKELLKSRLRESKMNSIRTLLATLRHEINNPLGAVLGGAFLIRSAGELGEEQEEAVKLIEASGNRIKHVINELCDAVELEEVKKANELLFHVPGDAPWEKQIVKTGRKK